MLKNGLKDWSFEYNNLKTVYGQCWSKRKIIYLSRPLTQAIEDKEKVLDTLLHEIAHALVGCREGHNKKWKMACIRMGAKPQRATPRTELPIYNYLYKCPNCDHNVKRFRKIRRSLACRRCCDKYNDGKYSMKFKLEFIN